MELTVMVVGVVATTRVALTECVNELAESVPVIVRGNVPGVAPAVTLSVAEPEPEMDCGLKLCEENPDPLTDRLTVPLYPPEPDTVTVYQAPPPGATVCELGDTVIVKSGVDDAEPQALSAGTKAPATGEPTPVTRS